jgi:hypothetical protein
VLTLRDGLHAFHHVLWDEAAERLVTFAALRRRATTDAEEPARETFQYLP